MRRRNSNGDAMSVVAGEKQCDFERRILYGVEVFRIFRCILHDNHTIAVCRTIDDASKICDALNEVDELVKKCNKLERECNKLYDELQGKFLPRKVIEELFGFVATH